MKIRITELLVSTFLLLYRTYKEALIPLFGLFKEILLIIYSKIIKVVFNEIIIPSVKFIYNNCVSLYEKLENFNKDKTIEKLVEYKNNIILYFKENNFEQVMSIIKTDSKIIYLFISTLIKERLNSCYTESFHVVCLYSDSNIESMTITINNLTKEYYLIRNGEDVKLDCKIFEQIPVWNENYNDKIYSN